MNLSANSIGFIAGVFSIALLCWLLRTRIESNPEPFFLSFTFFAFAGQFIRVAEATSRVIEEHRTFPGWGTMLLLVIPGVFVVLVQAVVMNRHRWVTRRHYKDLLTKGLKTNNLTGQNKILFVDSWSEVLLRITDVDLFPRGYSWLKRWFPENEEPKEKSRLFAWTVLPQNEFAVADGEPEAASSNGEPRATSSNGGALEPITVKGLEVPSTVKRHVLWWAYVLLCVLSWMLFVRTMLLSQAQQIH